MKKLGIWIPTRPTLRAVDKKNPGIFLESVASEIVRELKTEFEVVEGLDFRNASIRDGKVFFDEFDASQLDGYLWFSDMNKHSDSHDILVLEKLEVTVPVINPTKGLRIGLDKIKTSSFLKDNKIPVPEFALVNSTDEKTIRWIFENWGSVLVKPRFGSFGVGIYKADDPDDLLDLIDFSGIDTIYVEKFYENDMSDWCGINVVGGEILYAYGKHETKIKGYKVLDRKRLGGAMTKKTVDETQKNIALSVAKATGMDFFGVDLIKTKDGRYLVVDLNTFPGIYPEMREPKEIATEFLRMVKIRLG
ncbi:MAG: hypothetical protein ABID61_04840 [Candidatus Micrarchaeota archaeon]